MSDKELEKLFKRKLENQQHEFNPAAWSAMKNILDQKASGRGAFYWRSVVLILLFASLVSGIIFFSTTSTTGNDPRISNTAPAPVPALGDIPQTDNVETQATPGPAPRETQELTTGSGHAQNTSSPQAARIDSPGERLGVNSGTATEEKASPAEVDDAGNTQPKEANPLLLSAKGLAEIEPRIPALQKRSIGGFTPDALEKFQDRHEVLITAGPVLNDSYSNSHMGVGWHTGLTYQLRFSQSWAVSLGINYSVMNDVGISQRRDSTFYHFGSEKVEIQSNSNRLEYIEAPLNIAWQINPRHQVGAGIYAGRLVSVSEERVKKHISLSRETDVQKTTSSGLNENFEMYDYGFNLMYFYQLSPDFSFGLELRKGLNDITRDEAAPYNQKHQNLNTRITLRYRIF